MMLNEECWWCVVHGIGQEERLDEVETFAARPWGLKFHKGEVKPSVLVHTTKYLGFHDN